MDQYVTVKGIYDNGNVRLLEMPDTNLATLTEVLVLIPLRKGMAKRKKIGISVKDFAKKINLFSIGGDAIKETEDLYNG
jgi:hypothetical protein